MKKILVAVTDNEEAIRINNFLKENSFDPHIVTDSSTLINKINGNEFDFLIIDIDILEASELDLITFIRERTHSIQPLITTSKEKLDRVIKLAAKGNFSYLARPANLNELLYLIRKSELAKPKEKNSAAFDEYFEKKFVGRSEKIRKIMELVKKVAKSDSNILITGETGTGKELIARAIYEISSRADKPFIAVNSGAIPDNLLESELFGYVKGAFTGATGDKKGLTELADNGTLFMDEIGDLGFSLQAKVLRMIEYKEIRRLGDEEMKKVDIRIIAATNQDLKELVAQKKFREDLFFRLNVINIHIPPLRERKEDIPVLIRFFVDKYSKIFSKDITGIDSRARAVLAFYDYPGNVRELENIIQHAFTMAENDTITINDLPFYMQNVTAYPTLEAHEEIGRVKQKKGGEEGEFLLADMEKNTIMKAFAKYGINHTRVAKALGVSRSTLWRKMKEYRIKL